VLLKAKSAQRQALPSRFVQSLELVNKGQMTAMHAVKVAEHQPTGHRGKFIVRMLQINDLQKNPSFRAGYPVIITDFARKCK
jgi:hypothetical protein